MKLNLTGIAVALLAMTACGDEATTNGAADEETSVTITIMT